MKKRLLALALTLLLLFSAMTATASAAAPSEVYQFLKGIAMEGTYDPDEKTYVEEMALGDDVYYAVCYLESSKNVEIKLGTTSLEVGMVLTSAMRLPFTAYIKSEQARSSEGKVDVKKTYNAEAFTAFKTFTGDSAQKADMLEALNELLPFLLELTQMIIYYEEDAGYTLADMGLTAYRCHTGIHIWDEGQVTQAPTCYDSGVMTYTCVCCGEQEADSINPTGQHVWGPGVRILEPNCTRDGVLRYTCTVCKRVTYDEPIPALGHAWSLTERLTTGETLHDSTGRYTCSRCGDTKEAHLCAAEVFQDMPGKSNWAHNPIDWAYFGGITSGVTYNTFGPKETVTRAQAMTFLWNTLGSPAPETTQSPFSDVKPKHYYFQSVLWAVENHIT